MILYVCSTWRYPKLVLYISHKYINDCMQCCRIVLYDIYEYDTMHIDSICVHLCECVNYVLCVYVI